MQFSFDEARPRAQLRGECSRRALNPVEYCSAPDDLQIIGRNRHVMIRPEGVS